MKNNVFLEFCSIAREALNEALPEKNIECISNMYLIKYLFFSENEMEDESDNAKIEKRIYKWFQKNPDGRAEEADRKPETVDWLDVARNIDRLLSKDNEDDFKCCLYESVRRGSNNTLYQKGSSTGSGRVNDNEISYIDFMDKFKTDKFKTVLEKYIMDTLGTGLIEKNSSFGSRAAAFFIHGFWGKKVLENIPCGIQTNYYLERADMEKLVQDCADRKFVCVDGEAYSGKTTLLVMYAKKNGIKTVCCTGAASYEDVLDSIIIEEDACLDNKTKKRLGYLLNADNTELKEKRIGQLEETFWLVIDKFQGKQKDCKKLEQLSASGKVHVFLEPVRMFPFLQGKPVIKIEPMTDSEVRELFYLMKNKYNGQTEGMEFAPEEQLLENVRKAVYNNPGLMILIAEYYWGMQANGKRDKSGADVFLEEIAYGRTVGSGGYYSVLHSAKSGNRKTQKQHNISGHTAYLFEHCVPEQEQNVFYVLSLISSIDIELQYIEKWFGIDLETLGGLEWKGWCHIDQEKMRVGIPWLIVHALKKDVFKSARSVEPFRTYIRKMTETIMRKETQPVEVGMMQRVMLCLHNELLHRIHEKPSLVDKTVCEFHFACINHFLDYGNAAEAKGLMDETFSYETVRQCKGSAEYYKMLQMKQKYMESNNISGIIDDIIRIMKNYDIYQYEFAVNALYELVELYANRLLAASGMNRLELSENPEKIIQFFNKK